MAHHISHSSYKLVCKSLNCCLPELHTINAIFVKLALRPSKNYENKYIIAQFERFWYIPNKQTFNIQYLIQFIFRQDSAYADLSSLSGSIIQLLWVRISEAAGREGGLLMLQDNIILEFL